MAAAYVAVDTDVFSFIFKGAPQAEFFKPHLQNRILAVSFMTVAELYYGAYKRGWSTKNLARLEQQLRSYVVLPFDYAVCQQWAHVKVECEKVGISMSIPDTWHAACALAHQCPLATNNGRHFRAVRNLELITPGFTPL